MNGLRIGLVLRSLHTGGAEWQFAQLADALAQRGHEVTVFSLFPEGRFWGWLRDQGRVDCVSLFSRHGGPLGGKARWAAASLRLARKARDRRIQVLYAALPAACLVAWGATRPPSKIGLAWGIRGMEAVTDWRLRLPEEALRALSPTVPLVVFNSARIRAAYRDRGCRFPRAEIVPNGFDTARFRPDPEARAAVRSEWGVAPDHLAIGIVARLHPTKDHRLFLDVAARIAARCPEARFFLVGPDPDGLGPGLRAYADSLGLAEKVRLVGEREDLPAVYAALDLLVLTSVSESFPNVLGEALSTGTPCVSTDVGDAAEIVGDAGAVPNERSPDALAAAALQLLVDPEARRLASLRARQRVLEHYGTEALCVRTEELLADLVRS